MKIDKNAIYVTIFVIFCILIGAILGFSLSLYRERFLRKKSFYNMELKRRMPGHFFNLLGKRLDLSEEQRTKLREILEEARLRFQSLNDQVRTQAKQIRDDVDKKILEILTPEQQQRFKLLKEKLKNRFNRRKNSLEFIVGECKFFEVFS